MKDMLRIMPQKQLGRGNKVGSVFNRQSRGLDVEIYVPLSLQIDRGPDVSAMIVPIRFVWHNRSILK